MTTAFVRLADSDFPPSRRVGAVEGVETVLRTLLADATPIEWPHAGRHVPPQQDWIIHDFAAGTPDEGGGWGLRLRLRRAPLEAWLDPIARAEQAAALAASPRRWRDKATEAAVRLVGDTLADVDAGVRARAVAQWADEITVRVLAEIKSRLTGYVAHGAVPSLYPARARSRPGLFSR